jgi:hypothetical protein
MLVRRRWRKLVICFGTIFWYHLGMKGKHQKVLESIFASPIKSGIVWQDIENMLTALGAEISKGAGSRVRICLNDVRAVFHRPHPKKEADKGAIASMRRFLTEAKVRPS